MRWKNLLFITSFLVIIYLLLFVFISPILKNAIENTASSALGAKVELRSFNINIFTFKIDARGLQVTNPQNTKSNLFEIEKIIFKLNLPALLESRTIIQVIAVEDIRIATPRKSDGAVYKKQKHESGKQDKLPGKTTRNPLDIFQLDIGEIRDELEIDKYINGDLKTIQAAELIKNNTIETAGKWKKELDELKYYHQMQEIRKDIEKINPEIKNLDEIPGKIRQINSIKNKIQKTVNDFKNYKNEFEKDFSQLQTDTVNLDKIARQELLETLSNFKLASISVENIGSLLFEDEIMEKVNKLLYWLDLAGSFIPEKSDNNEAGKIKKQKGYDVQFPISSPNPKFLIREIIITTTGNGSLIENYPTITGVVKNIVDDQNRIDAVTAFELGIILPGFNNLEAGISGSFDRRLKKSIDKYRLSVKNFPIKKINLAGKNGFPKSIDSASLDTEGIIEINKNQTIIKNRLDLKSIKLNYTNQNVKKEFEKILKEIFLSIDILTLDFELNLSENNKKVIINSNLDELFISKMKKIINDKLILIRKEFEDKFYARIKEVQKQAFAEIKLEKNNMTLLYNEQEKLITKERSTLNEELAILEKEVNSIKNKLEEEAKKLINTIPLF